MNGEYYGCLGKNDQDEKENHRDTDKVNQTVNSAPTLNSPQERKFIDSVKIIGSKLICFEDGIESVYETNLFYLEYSGQRITKDKVPYFISAGRTCDECDEHTAIHIWSPSVALFFEETNHSSYPFPGEEVHYLLIGFVYSSRAFVGNCLGYEGRIWIQKSKTDSNEWESNAFEVRVVDAVIIQRDRTLNKLDFELMKT